MNECLQQAKWLVKIRVKKEKGHGLSYGINKNSVHEYGKNNCTVTNAI